MNNLVLCTYHNQVARLVMNRPEKRNALNSEMVEALKDALSEIRLNTEAKVVVLEGAGDAFCAGADLAYLQKLQNNTFDENYLDSSSLKDLFHQLYTFPKPVIAKINGPAIAGGCGLATVCDFSIASDNSTFGYSEVRIGFVPAIVMVFLTKKIGEGRAKELLLSAKMLKASEAANYAMINQVVSQDKLEETVVALAENLAQNCSPQAIQMVKEMFFEMPTDYAKALDYAAQMNARARATSDCKKGINAFLNKQKITW